MKYEVTNISNTTYVGVIKIKSKETLSVTKEVYTYLESTFGKFNKFEFKTTGTKEDSSKIEKTLDKKDKEISNKTKETFVKPTRQKKTK